jgi:ABC-type lipoprotein export system ATPase subunit
MTILMVTHDESLARRTDRHITMLDGRIAAEWESAQVLAHAPDMIAGDSHD